jgi:exodeoxyribonuclease V alpha subunit
MSARYTFDSRPAPESTPWRPLDSALAQWVRAHGGSGLLARVAAWASFAFGSGDTALPLSGDDAGRHGMAPLSADDIAALRMQTLVGDEAEMVQGAVVTPFVLDALDRFYLRRNYADEVAVARLINARRSAYREPAADPGAIAALFHDEPTVDAQRQRDAVSAVLGRTLFVLTGGPGTGKTTTVLRMLLMLQRQAGKALSIQVAAPTGKAAQRLVQSLRKGKKDLLEHLVAPLPADWQQLLDAIPDADVLTLHRLLGFDPHRQVFRRGRFDPIAADIVVVDEASMVDLSMLRALLEATPADATLILVGDADQLTSVAAGSALMDLVAVMEGENAADIVRLEHSFRAQRHLVPINQAVRVGDAAALGAAWAAAGHDAVRRECATRRDLAIEIQRWTSALARLELRPTLPALLDTDNASAGSTIAAQRVAIALAALHALTRRQLLCALRENDFGALRVNDAIERGLKRAWHVPVDQVWYPGRAVMIVRNDYAAGLFNGDAGVCLADGKGDQRVWFETTTADGVASARSVSTGSLPVHEGAFAITIHKSQGSEYVRAAVLLPADAENRILSRQLLYTGLSRAKQHIELWSTEASLLAAVANPVRRSGGLADRLK